MLTRRDVLKALPIVKRMGVVCEDERHIPQAKVLLQKWADDGCPPFDTHIWHPV